MSEQLQVSLPVQSTIRDLVVVLEARDKTIRDQRKHERHILNVAAEIYEKANDGIGRQVSTAWATDLSIGGVGCLADHSLLQDGAYYISFELGEQSRYTVPIRVLESHSLFKHINRLNCSFMQED